MGKVYADADQFQTLFEQMFDDVADDAGMATLVEQRMVIRFRLSDPDVDLWVDGRAAPVTTAFRPLEAEPTLIAQLSTDSLHELLLGTLPLGRALLFRKLRVKGSKTQAMKLEPLLHALQRVYPDLAGDLGR